jgi:predicted amino acid-binding ACT domain protein
VRTHALSAIGADRPGIIAAVAQRLVTHGVNVTP